MLSVWIDFELKMRGLTRTTFKLVNLLFGKLCAKGSD